VLPEQTIGQSLFNAFLFMGTTKHRKGLQGDRKVRKGTASAMMPDAAIIVSIARFVANSARKANSLASFVE